MTYTSRRCDSCNRLVGEGHASWCTAKLQPVPGAKTRPGLMTFTVLEKG